MRTTQHDIVVRASSVAPAASYHHGLLQWVRAACCGSMSAHEPDLNIVRIRMAGPQKRTRTLLTLSGRCWYSVANQRHETCCSSCLAINPSPHPAKAGGQRCSAAAGPARALKRSSPLSTNTQCRRAPTTLCTSVAATVLSTPPLSAQITCSSGPTCPASARVKPPRNAGGLVHPRSCSLGPCDLPRCLQQAPKGSGVGNPSGGRCDMPRY